MPSLITLRHILAVTVLVSSGGCTGGDVLRDLTPEPESKAIQVDADRLTTLKQDISSVGYSTYLGFSGNEQGTKIAVDGAGNAYVTGRTSSFGTTYNIFVAKMSPSGSLLYFTYYPGYYSRGIAVDASGSVYVVGDTLSGGKAITKINSTGTAIVYSATLGWQAVTGVRVDPSGNAYVVGEVANGVSGYDVAVGKVNPTGTAFVYALAFGGSGDDIGTDLALDPSGNVYIAGSTSSTDFPVVNPMQPTARGSGDAFVAKLNATGTALMYSTYLGGGSVDVANAIAVDSGGNAYVTGSTVLVNGVGSFPVTAGAVQTTAGGGPVDAFAVKLSPVGGLLYATYIGGNVDEEGLGIAVNSAGAVDVVGSTGSPNFPTSSLAFQRFFQGGVVDAFVIQLSPTFNAYTYSTYLGGNSTDTGLGIAVDPSNNVYVTGDTYSTNFPTNVYGPGGNYDAYVTKFNAP